MIVCIIRLKCIKINKELCFLSFNYGQNKDKSSRTKIAYVLFLFSS